MILKLFSILCAVLVYFGFASLLGASLRQVRRAPLSENVIAMIAFAVLVYIPLSLALPMPPAARLLVWVSALLLVWLYSRRPASVPNWLWQPRTALLYAAAVMALVLLWSLTAGATMLAPMLDLLAAAAGLLAWRRSRLYTA